MKSKPGAEGFTLLELMIVVIILGIVAAIVVQSFSDTKKDAENAAFVTSVDTLSKQFRFYKYKHKAYPPDATPGIIPQGMAPYLERASWVDGRPLGGRWDWDYQQLHFGCSAGVSVYMPDRTVSEMQEIDNLLDDGNLATGLFRARSGGYIFIIEY